MHIERTRIKPLVPPVKPVYPIQKPRNREKNGKDSFEEHLKEEQKKRKRG